MICLNIARPKSDKRYLFCVDIQVRYSVDLLKIYIIKILLVGDEVFHADGRTDMTKVAVAFSLFCERP